MPKNKKDKAQNKDPKPVAPDEKSNIVVDPVLAALFAGSSGPVTVPTRPSRSLGTTLKPAKGDTEESEAEAGTGSSAEDVSDQSDNSEDEQQEQEQEPERPRKRRRVVNDDNLEANYLNKLVQEEAQELEQRKKEKAHAQQASEGNEESDAEASDSDLNSDLADLSDDEEDGDQGSKVKIIQEDEDGIPKHESLTATAQNLEAEKTNRTVFLGNVSISCIKSKPARKSLVQHLQSAIDMKHHEKVESIRFRSTAFVADAGPKRAAYAKKDLMEETMRSTNAYVVLSSPAAARKVATKLNATVLLDRHLRADYMGQPSKVDHKRCVFVGNLSFTDEAPAPETAEGDDATKKRKRAKDPADVEEGLWRTFGRCGKVESVRVVRDKETRISKGFAYVQFYDENAVESALLLHEKKFPPMLPRLLRVSRAKRELKKDKRAKAEYTGPANKRPRTAGPPGARGPRNGASRPAPAQDRKFVFEGNRATSSAMPRGLKKMKKRPAVKPTNRGAKRAAAFRAGGGKKKRDTAS